MELHLADVDISFSCVGRILNLRKLVGDNITDIHDPGSLNLGNKVGVRILKYIYIEIKF